MPQTRCADMRAASYSGSSSVRSYGTRSQTSSTHSRGSTGSKSTGLSIRNLFRSESKRSSTKTIKATDPIEVSEEDPEIIQEEFERQLRIRHEADNFLVAEPSSESDINDNVSAHYARNRARKKQTPYEQEAYANGSRRKLLEQQKPPLAQKRAEKPAQTKKRSSSTDQSQEIEPIPNRSQYRASSLTHSSMGLPTPNEASVKLGPGDRWHRLLQENLETPNENENTDSQVVTTRAQIHGAEQRPRRGRSQPPQSQESDSLWSLCCGCLKSKKTTHPLLRPGVTSYGAASAYV